MPIAARCTLALLVLAPAAALADGGLLSVSDQNPLIRGAYLPLPPVAGAPAEGFGFAAALQWSNTVNLEQTATEQLHVDEETAELDLELSHAAGPWRFRALLPVISRGGGVLDGVVDDWHRFWHLPQGDRPLVPSNAFAIRYRNSAGESLDAEHGTALGDLALELGHEWRGAGPAHVALFAGVELPSGDRARLTSDQAVNAALWLEAGTDLGSRFSIDGRAGASRTGGALPLPAERTVDFGTLALSWHARPALDAVLQFDGHSRVVAGSDLKFLSHAVQMTLAARYRLASGGHLELGFTEDIEVDHSPDITFHLGWRWPLH